MENASEEASKRRGQSAPSHTQFKSLASDKKNIFSWYAAVFSDTSTEYTIRNTETDQQDPDLGAHNDEKLDKGFSVDENKIADTLTAMHSSLCTSEFPKYREYRKCPTGTVQETNAQLAALMKEDVQAKREPKSGDSARRHNGNNGTEPELDRGRCLSTSTSDSEGTSRSERHYHRLFKRKRRFVHVMKELFQVFLPLRYTSEMIAKYWGAVNVLLQVLSSKFARIRRIVLTFLAESRHTPAMASFTR